MIGINTDDIEAKLLANLPVDIGNSLIYYPTPFRKASDVGLSTYNYYVSLLLIDRSAFDKELDANITNFDIFYANCYHDSNFKDAAFSALRLFFMNRPTMHEDEDGVSIRFSFKNTILNHTNFDSFQSILKTVHHLKTDNKPEFKPKNSKAQEMIDMIMKNRKSQPTPKEKMDLVSIVSGLSWKSNGISIISAFDLNIYQIYSGFFTTNNIDNYHHTLSGLYAGTIDGKKLNMSDIHWANKIKQ